MVDKLVPVNPGSYSAWLEQFLYVTRNSVCAATPNGTYVVTDESGIGFKGVMKSKGGHRVCNTLGRDALPQNIATDFDFLPEHSNLLETLKLLPLDVMLTCFEAGHMEIDFINTQIPPMLCWNGEWNYNTIASSMEWKSLLVEKDVTFDYVKDILSNQVTKLDFDATAFFYSPEKGLYLP